MRRRADTRFGAGPGNPCWALGRPWLPWVALCGVLALAPFYGGCTSGVSPMAKDKQPMPRRDINAVLHDHDRELLAIPGVVGIYVGLLEDGRTPCLKVMVTRQTPQVAREVPKQLEGYPVVVEETGPIRPMPGR